MSENYKTSFGDTIPSRDNISDVVELDYSNTPERSREAPNSTQVTSILEDELIDADPMDYYEEYSEWLCNNELCWNGNRLVELLESAHRFDEFLEWHKRKHANGSILNNSPTT